MLLSSPWIIPIIPAVAFVAILTFGTKLPRKGAELGIAAMVMSTLLSLWMAIEFAKSDRTTVVSKIRWFDIGALKIDAGTLVDGLTVTMVLLVSIISLMVQIFSANYMHNDRRYTHFFGILTFFTASMQWFVMSANTLQMMFGWEVMALCSFLLIGHWWEEKSNVHAAMKAFLTTRASDVGLFIGVAILFFAAGSSFDIIDLNNAATAGVISEGLLLAGASALFLAVIGKSAQFPLHTWLPDAMAGPTPMSALIHAATMVVAGVFMVARLYPVFVEGFSINDGSLMNPLNVVGAITILIAALLAFVQSDLKKLLSYSTVSQLGYMVMALGVGAWTAAIFHLVTHAFAKALLFLNAGSVSHTVHGFDIEKDMGGLRKTMPITHATFVVGAASLVGVIPLSGFWSKEAIASDAWNNGYQFFAVIAIIGTLLTACYMTRCYYLVFLGKHRGSSIPHESQKALTVPLIVLAAATILSSALYMPMLGVDFFTSWLGGQDHAGDTGILWVVEITIAILGLAGAKFAYAKGIGPRYLANRFGSMRGLYTVLHNRYYLDWLYEKVFIHGIRRGLSWLVHWVDHNVVDNFVDAVGMLTVKLGRVVDRQIDTRLVDGAVKATSAATEGSGTVISKGHVGKVQVYIVALFAAVVLIATLALLGSG